MSERPTCGTCRFYAHQPAGGACRRHAPTPGNGFRCIWPDIEADEWCGEHEPQPIRLDNIGPVSRGRAERAEEIAAALWGREIEGAAP